MRYTRHGPKRHANGPLSKRTPTQLTLRLVAVLAASAVWLAAATGVSGAQETASHPSDRQALLELYERTDGTNWRNAALWGSEAPLERWHGVTTDREGRVIALRLPDNGLSGEIPTALGTLDGLEVLDLSYNEMVGEIPGELGALSELRVLDLNTNRLERPIPPEIGDLAPRTARSSQRAQQRTVGSADS